MQTIHKFAINPGKFEILLPVRARFLTVGIQEAGPQMWFELEPDLPRGIRHFCAVPTGGEVPFPGTYLGTVHSVEGWMVFHIYEL